MNRLPTSVLPIQQCVAHAFDPDLSSGERPQLAAKAQPQHASNKTPQTGLVTLKGEGLLSQKEFSVRGRAMVTDVPITYLGYVNRDTGVVEEFGHPLDGRAIEDTILMYPKGSGSTVAPYVLMGLLYTGKGPKAIVNSDVCPPRMENNPPKMVKPRTWWSGLRWWRARSTGTRRRRRPTKV